MTISYSMCWEDPVILTQTLNITKNDSVLSIVSGGENIFALCIKQPKKLVGIDIKKEQIYLTKLKMAAIKSLEFEEFIEFMGFKKSNRRIEIFNKIKSGLTDGEVGYWNKNLRDVANGIIHCGKFESYLSKFRRYALPLIISKRRIEQFLKLDTLDKQKKFYDLYWDNWRFKLSFKIFFSKKGLERGRDKEYFKHSSKRNISNHYLDRVKHALTSIPIKSNYFMQYILIGTIKTPFSGHPYLDKKNYESLKGILKTINIDFIRSSLKEYLRSSEKIRFSKFNLSDIFEATSNQEYFSLLGDVRSVSEKRGKVCYWNNLVRRANHPKIEGLKKNVKKSSEMYSKDRVHFYSNFILEDIN